MAAIFVIVLEKIAHKPDKMTPVKDDHMVEQFSSAATDPSLRDAILPGTTISRSGGLGAHSPHESHHGGTDDSVPIEYKVPWWSVVRERLA